MIDGMKNAGFKTIRIPVAWSNMVSDDGNYTISMVILIELKKSWVMPRQ